MNETEFLAKYDIEKSDIENLHIGLNNLMEIETHYNSIYEKLIREMKREHEDLADCRYVHSTKRRVKSTKSLIKKIIRKNYDVNADNYLTRITDIIGLRAIHLTKNDWLQIHNYILENWKPVEKPKAFLREGDSVSLRNLFNENGCDVEDHRFGYRSVHYIVETVIKPDLTLYFEIQVRTIFEEGWSEVDHKYRYPNALSNNFLAGSSNILNLIAGIADQMALFIDDFQGEYENSLKLKRELMEVESRMSQTEIDLKNEDYMSAFSNLTIMANSIATAFSTLKARDESLEKAISNFDHLGNQGISLKNIVDIQNLVNFNPAIKKMIE
ncbi:MAG: RelA/SpoT domain-containing protein [Spirochaetes bacterium]|nr:RelA/SpoT domain-containing protein [Spirochaetota bacterium]